MKPEDLPGRFVHEGQLIGYVLPDGSRIVRATIRQDDIDLVRTSLRGAVVKLGERLEQTLPVRIVRDDRLVSPTHPGLYPAGEGAGYAGGIVSAAVDGMRVADAILAAL